MYSNVCMYEMIMSFIFMEEFNWVSVFECVNSPILILNEIRASVYYVLNIMLL